jgi:hypothetical protein
MTYTQEMGHKYGGEGVESDQTPAHQDKTYMAIQTRRHLYTHTNSR